METSEKERSKNPIKFLKHIPANIFSEKSLENIVNDFFIFEKYFPSWSYENIKSFFRKSSINFNTASSKYLLIKLTNSALRYKLIPVRTRNRKYFPGYQVNFQLKTDMGVLNVHISSGRADDKPGDMNAGTYIVGGLQDWYNKHKEIT